MDKQYLLSLCFESRYLEHAVRSLVSENHGFTVIHSCHSVDELMPALKNRPSKFIITDVASYSMKGKKAGSSNLERIRLNFPDIHIVVITNLLNKGIVRDMLESGVSGIVSQLDAVDVCLKACESLAKNNRCYLSHVLTERTSQHQTDELPAILTTREYEIVHLYASGLTLAEIAERQCRSISTISSQKWSAMRRLGITTNIELIRYAYSQGIIS